MHYTKQETTAWAVYLGCTSAERLAQERGISLKEAARLLSHACTYGHIWRVGHGRYQAKREALS